MADFRQLDDQVAAAARRFPKISPHLEAIPLRVIVEPDRALVMGRNDRVPVAFPLDASELVQGLWFIEHDASARPTRLIALHVDDRIHAAMNAPMLGVVTAAGSKGQQPKNAFAVLPTLLLFVHPEDGHTYTSPIKSIVPLGARDYLERRKNARAVFWVTTSLRRDPVKSGPDLFPVRNYPEVADAAALLRQPGWSADALVIDGPGPAITTLAPGQFYDEPLRFTYHARSPSEALVSRVAVGRTFYYRVKIRDVERFQEGWVYRAVGRNTAGMAMMAQLIVEIATSMLPIVGPLFNLFQTGKGIYHAVNDWSGMKSWEKVLLGVDVLLTAVTGAVKGARLAQGLRHYDESVRVLQAAGSSEREAKTLARAAAVFKDLPASRQIVDALADKLAKGGELTVAEMRQVENITKAMLKNLPPAERLAQGARFAMRDLTSAREFLHGLDLSEELLTGLRNLSPDVLVQVRALVKDQQLTHAFRIASWSRTPSVAAGINLLADAVKDSHLTDIALSVGDEVLGMIGRGEIGISQKLAEQVLKQKGSGKAYAVLMRGAMLGGEKVRGRKVVSVRIAGLNDQMAALRHASKPLDPPLFELQEVLQQVYLTRTQLRGLRQLSDAAIDVIRNAPGVSDAQIHALATIATKSPETAKAMDRVLTALAAAKVRPHIVPSIVERLGGGVLEALEKQGVALPAELLAGAARKADPRHAALVLLDGIGKTDKAAGVQGLIGRIAGTVGSADTLAKLVARIEHPALQADLFARWAVRNPSEIPGVAEVMKFLPKGGTVADATRRLRGIHIAFGPESARNVLAGLKWVAADGPVPGIDALIADLAAGAEKAMGASLVLDFCVKHLKAGQVTEFEHWVRNAADTVRRRYDILAGATRYEVKYWTHFGGDALDAALGEFVRDVQFNAATDFKNLRWIISGEMRPFRGAIAEAFLETLVARRAEIENALPKVITFEAVEQSLRRALDPRAGWLIDFAD